MNHQYLFFQLLYHPRIDWFIIYRMSQNWWLTEAAIGNNHRKYGKTLEGSMKRYVHTNVMINEEKIRK